MRLFVGISIASAVLERIAECVDELRRRVEARAPRARISWVAADHLHVTVRFIGEAGETEAQRIASSLAPVLRVAPFDVAFQGVGTFPDRGAPRVFWAGIGAGAEQLMSIEREVTTRLVACGIDPEQRDYRPHVTLARVREHAGLSGRELLDGLADRSFGDSTVDAITLFQSRLSPRGSVYVPLQSTELRIR
jgi:RNA 2',3'-cyclic 3'-phosphodiesterase